MFLLSLLLASTPITPVEQESAVHNAFESSLYFGSGTFLSAVSIVSGISGTLCQLAPWSATLGNELLLTSEICGIGAKHAFYEMFRKSPYFSFFCKKEPSTHSAWSHNKELLEQIPITSHGDKQLLHFLQERWLAKTTGCYPFLVNWMCPSFGIHLQTHPHSTNSYARDPSIKYPETYLKRVESWKAILPQPKEFPLILTRPADIRDYFPYWFEIAKDEKIDSFVAKLTNSSSEAPVIIDLTAILPNDAKNWSEAWHSFESELETKARIDLNQVQCIQKVEEKDIGGFRLLPLASANSKITQKHYEFLLARISKFGLSANTIELDRLFLSSETPAEMQVSSPELESKEQLLAFLDSIDTSWKSTHPQKTLMFKGTIQVLKDFCAQLPEKMEISSTRAAAAHISFNKIKAQLAALKDEDSFYTTIVQIEQTLADLTSLLEIFAPYAYADFQTAFCKHLTIIPEDLKPLTQYGIHSTGMTSLAGIFKAAEKALGRTPRILYGENIYFECIYSARRISDAIETVEATDEDWKEVDVILLQFNPALKRIDFNISAYHVENISAVLHKALKFKQGAPLTIALDTTLDYSNSQRVGALLEEFKNEIKNGALNVVCYRSGSKYDLFGMDNFCGAPFYMLNNGDVKWSSFDALLADPALQTDRLSLNWFALVYQNAAPYLEKYRKQIFENTRAALDKAPKRLFTNRDYRIIPMASDIDPSFIDIKVYGPCHELRAGLLVGVLLTVKCMEGGHPLFYRPSLGFYHPNLAVLFGNECTTIRLTLGLDPAQVAIIGDCFRKIDKLNGYQNFNSNN